MHGFDTKIKTCIITNIGIYLVVRIGKVERHLDVYINMYNIYVYKYKYVYIYIFTYVHTKDPNHQIRFPSRAFCAVAEAICRITATRCLAELTATVAASIASIECPI